MRCPYNQEQLLVAGRNANNKFMSYEHSHGEGSAEKRLGELLSVPPDGPATNARIAAHHGITVDALVCSPSYKDLREDYNEQTLLKGIETLKTEFGLTDKEAWSVFWMALTKP